MAGRGISALRHLPDAPSRPSFGRGRARFSSAHLDDDETAMALLRRQLETFAQAPLTPDTPGPSSTAAYGQFDDHPSDAGTMTPHSPGNTSGAATPRRRPRCASEASSSLVSTPRSSSSYNFRGDDDPDCVCYREKKQVICRMCGEAYRGRVRRKCPVHCNVKMLMDNDLCSKCGIPCLFEFDTE